MAGRLRKRALSHCYFGRMQPLDPHNPKHLNAIVSVWNAACGDEFSISPRAAQFNIQPNTGILQDGRLVFDGGQPIGFVVARADTRSHLGWIEALGVTPSHQRRGVGAQMMAWGQAWLAGQASAKIRIGGGIRPFAPGVPVALNTQGFFARHGYTKAKSDWDVARDISGYVPRGAYDNIRPAAPSDLPALREFFARSFANRWQYEFEELVRDGGNISDYLVLWTERGVDGFVQTTFEQESYRPIDRFFMRSLPRPHGQLGPLGVSADLRGKGYGLAMIDAAIAHLQKRGAKGCVIDWTDLLGLYGKFGFTPFHEYAIMTKAM